MVILISVPGIFFEQKSVLVPKMEP
ncbi:hypothetical protein M5689_005106 [Euphorbia peplus]|nr:hypothetical protein M5689_005106 [Euphorbia peplus]